MNLSLNIYVLLAVSLGLASCAHHRDVRAGADGTHRVLVRAPHRESAERSAISQANHYCEQFKKSAAFVDEKTEYKGEMDENTRNTINKASQAAIILGGVGTTAGHGHTRTGGSVLGGAGVLGSVMTGGDDYVADMHFKCN